MIRKALSTVFAVLLIGTVLLAQCAFCKPVQTHQCCKPVKSHCGKQMPVQSCATHSHTFNYEKAESDSGKLTAFATSSNAALSPDLVTIAPVPALSPVPALHSSSEPAVLRI
ncbi:MAG: hypothetical protein ABI693_01590 [Bryobacteraceae bacterium]